MSGYAVPTNKFTSKAATVYEVAQPITPTDNTAIGPYLGFIVGVSGNVVLVMRNGDSAGGVTAVTVAATAGVIYPLSFQGINATNTTATGITGLA